MKRVCIQILNTFYIQFYMNDLVSVPISVSIDVSIYERLFTDDSLVFLSMIYGALEKFLNKIGIGLFLSKCQRLCSIGLSMR